MNGLEEDNPTRLVSTEMEVQNKILIFSKSMRTVYWRTVFTPTQAAGTLREHYLFR